MMRIPLKLNVDVMHPPETGANNIHILIAHDQLLLLPTDDHVNHRIVVMMMKMRGCITARLTREVRLHHLKSYQDTEIDLHCLLPLINVDAHLLLQDNRSRTSGVKTETAPVRDIVINSSTAVILHLPVPLHLHLHPPLLRLILLHQDIGGRSLTHLIDDLLPDLVLKKNKKQLVHRWFGSLNQAAVVHLPCILPLHLPERDKERLLTLLLHVLHLLFHHLQPGGGSMKRDTIKDDQNLIR